MEPAVGASTCASGSQVCSGNNGTLIAKAMKNARNSSISVLRQECDLAALDLVENLDVVEGAGQVVQVDYRAQHEHGPGEGVQEKLDGGVDAPVMAPDSDQEVHGDQGNFPEHVEQEQVERNEDADQPEFEQDQKGEELFDAMVDGLPRHQNRNRREEGGQQHQPERQAVQADVVVNRRRRDPDAVVNESKALRRRRQ